MKSCIVCSLWYASKRVLINFFVHVLLLLSYEGKWEEAIFSNVKHQKSVYLRGEQRNNENKSESKDKYDENRVRSLDPAWKNKHAWVECNISIRYTVNIPLRGETG